MVDCHAGLVAALSTVLPTHYEMTLTSKTRVPCISYMEVSNAVHTNGETQGYSRVSYQVKIWGNSVAELQRYALQVDKALRPLGWTRTSTGELYDRESTLIQKIMNYEGLTHETFV